MEIALLGNITQYPFPARVLVPFPARVLVQFPVRVLVRIVDRNFNCSYLIRRGGLIGNSIG